ncbi:hypothetical protein BDF20DRAFT_867539 [Mycotypha africana]|uniref:uncharacterized protein n=1 Tax=Mycotypha africana TaxID=64632 RepID=UPI002301D3B3|nr:uncharacterized protein BDF20DRAFT_867539 [Mycotypha africana]KAI8979081.1 hypothetical protein BDF20DRAFT_867539 [Mycotypha africana]
MYILRCLFHLHLFLLPTRLLHLPSIIIMLFHLPPRCLSLLLRLRFMPIILTIVNNLYFLLLIPFSNKDHLKSRSRRRRHRQHHSIRRVDKNCPWLLQYLP